MHVLTETAEERAGESLLEKGEKLIFPEFVKNFLF